MHLTATTQFGLEELLADELYHLGADITHIGSRAVEFIGDQRLLYEVALWSRLSMRLLRPFAVFHAADEKALYREVGRIDWQDFIGADQTFAITSVVNRSTFEHSLFVSQLTKDAIVDQFRARTGERPSVDTRTPDIRLHLRMSENEVILSLDAAGDSLHRRGYRQHTNEAPLNEVLAAGLVLLSGWDAKKPLIDPMCGSATILTEAGLISQRIAPGLFHQGKFGFENWYDFDPALWNQVREEAKAQRLEEPQAYLAGSDLDPKTIDMAAANITAAGLEDFIRLSVRDVKDATAPAKEEPGIVITNPPYGERIGEETEMAALYKTIGDALKANFQGYDAFVLTGNLEAAKSIGLKAARRMPLFNGPIDCRLLKYELYRGSRRAPGPHPPAPSPAERGSHGGTEDKSEDGQ
ncbi:RNA methyltransferase [Hymenobacter frigidus]|uniref:RNA methyltransferase n=1 Tax=Hymenobacter frigidus TaxID=1524095 RepID=A0ABQ2A701_9BACT|nr:THUMP domain-containing protein [Hymenobacter frigidus]GGH87283.1 RNA methyltransferase [Hymenobacter frigidus]